MRREKKITIIAICALLVLTFYGCSGSGHKTEGLVSAEPGFQSVTEQSDSNIESFANENKAPLYSEGYVLELDPFVNGVARLVGTEDGKTMVTYIDAKGNTLFSYQRHYSYLSSRTDDHDLFGIGDHSFLVSSESGIYALFDQQGNLLRTFNITQGDEYRTIGAMSENLFFVEELVKTPTGNSSNMVYLDENGNEVLRFENTTHAGAASCFFEDSAFICRLSEKEELSYMGLGENWPTDWRIISKDGTVKTLELADPLAFSKGDYADLDISGYTVYSVKPFYPGEEFASALVMITADGSQKYVPACISRDGMITISPVMIFNINELHYSHCYKDTVIIKSGLLSSPRLWDVKTNRIIDFDDVPTIKAVDELKSFFSYSINFMDDGSFCLSFSNHENDHYYLRVGKDGTELEEAHLGNPKMPVSPWNWYRFYYSKSSYGFQKSHDIFSEIGDAEAIIPSKRNNNNEMYAEIDKENYYAVFSGEKHFGDVFTLLGDFNEGLALVCTESKMNHYQQVATHPAIIDEKGNIITYLYESAQQ